MPDEDITARLRAVERALTDGDTAVENLSETAAVHERLDALAADVGALTERLDALDAIVQSLHGYVGELEHVNDRVRRFETLLARATLWTGRGSTAASLDCSRA